MQTPLRARPRSLLSCNTGFIVHNTCSRPLRLAIEALLSDERGTKAGYCNNGIVLPNVVSADLEVRYRLAACDAAHLAA